MTDNLTSASVDNPAGEGPMSPPERGLRYLLQTLVWAVVLMSLPGLVGLVAIFMPRTKVGVLLVVEPCFVGAVVVGVLALRRGRPLRQGFAMVAFAVGLL